MCVYSTSEHETYDAGNSQVFWVEEMIVCNTENYMYDVCTSCPSAETLKVLLQNEWRQITNSG
jgi:hypothetical protein